MFGKLKDKLKGALSIFSKKAEEEAEESLELEREQVEEEIKEIEEDQKTPTTEEILDNSLGEEKEVDHFVETPPKPSPETAFIQGDVPSNKVKITYFVHGTTIDNEQGKSTGWNPGELSETGIKQSKDLKNEIKGKKFDAVFVSDLKRAVDSAELTFDQEFIKDERLRECNYGNLNGADEEEVNYLKHIDKPFPNGESNRDVERRISEFLNCLYQNYKGKHVAILAHKSPQLAIEVLTKGKTWEDAIESDWRMQGRWQPGWEYFVEKEFLIETKDRVMPEKLEPIPPTPLIKQESIRVEPTVEVIDTEPEKKSFFTKIKEKFHKDVPGKKVREVLEKKEVTEPVKQEVKEPENSFLGKVTEKLTTKTINQEKFDKIFWDLEVALLENNVSVEVIDKIKDNLKEELVDKALPRDVEKKISNTLKDTLNEVLSMDKIDILSMQQKPLVIAFFGINGSGKTTSIAKLCNYFQNNDRTVVLAACDTFRAAAIQQLQEHADKLGVKMIKHDYGSDAAAVAFDAVQYAQKNEMDVVLIDTAGRLHSNTNLMDELAKIIKVTKPDLKIFVGESITGNDCIEQAKKFNELIDLDGIILTKVDVDEKGGAPLSIAYTIQKPILFLGTGQEYQNFEEFDKKVILERLGL